MGPYDCFSFGLYGKDASDIQGLHDGQGKVQEFLKSPAVQAVTTCEANLVGHAIIL